MYKYYCITCHTPYVGEQNYYYVRAKSHEEFDRLIDECLQENADEWYDVEAETDYPDYDDYLADCHVNIEEVSAEEYYENNPWDKEEE